MKEYIIIRPLVPANFVPVVAAHASLLAHMKWQNDFFYRNWLNNHFKKVICSSTEEEFWECDKLPFSHKFTESNLDNQYVAVVLMPRLEWPDLVQKLKLWKP